MYFRCFFLELKHHLVSFMDDDIKIRNDGGIDYLMEDDDKENDSSSKVENKKKPNAVALG